MNEYTQLTSYGQTWRWKLLEAHWKNNFVWGPKLGIKEKRIKSLASVNFILRQKSNVRFGAGAVGNVLTVSVRTSV